MRRSLASLLLTLFSSSLITPFLSAHASPELPACCRRDGKHRCAIMDAAMQSSSGPSLVSRCPLFPQTHGSPNSPSPAVFAVPNRVAGICLPVSALPHAVEFILPCLLLNSECDRGPPSCFD